MTYKLISLAFALFAIFQNLIFSKSISTQITSKGSSIMGLFVIPCFLWGAASFGLLLGWWALLAFPAVVFVLSLIAASFIAHVYRSGDSILSGQFGYGFFMLLFTACSILPHVIAYF